MQGRHGHEAGEAAPEALIERIAASLGAAFGERLVAVALFGSRARGDAGPDSDVDLLVVARGLPRAWDRGTVVRRAAGRLPLVPPVSFLSRTPEEFDADVRPLHLHLALDARVVFERDAWLTRRLERLRVLIDEARLVRRANLFWEWTEPPRRRDWAITWQGVVK